MVITVNNADERLLEVINALSRYSAEPYIVSSDSPEYSSHFVDSVLQAQEECKEGLKNHTIGVAHTKEDLHKALYEAV